MRIAENTRQILALVSIIVLAVVLRIYGLRWGLPNELHSYSYHPDEFLTIGSSANVAGLAGGPRTLNTGLYNYPSLYLYISAFSMMIANGYGWLGSAQNAYLAARIITVLMGAGSVVATYWAGRILVGNVAGLAAAFILAIAPLHVQHSHFATVDVPSTLFVALCLGYSGLILKRGSWRDYILAGVMAGLAGGTKYNAVLVIFAPIVAHFLAILPSSILSSVEGCGKFSTFSRLIKALSSAKLWIIPACAIAVFIISTPGCILYTGQFLYGLKYEMLHASQGHGLVFAGTGNGFFYTLDSSLWYGLAPLLGLLAIAAVVGALWKRDKGQLAILAFVIPYFVLISLSQVRFARYTLPLFPALALLSGWVVNEAIKLHSSSSGQHLAVQSLVEAIRKMYAATLCMMGIVLLFVTLIVNSIFGMPDPRDEAARWISSNVQKGSSVGLLDYPWFYTPPLSKSFGFGTLPQRAQAVNTAPYQIKVFSQNGWAKQRPQWIITTDYETLDALRLKNNNSISSEQKLDRDRTLAGLDIIEKNYTLRRKFANKMTVGIGGLYTDQFPHDMRYVSPTIYVYELKR